MLNGLIAMDERERMVPIDRAALVEAVAHLLTDDRSVTKLRHAGIGLVALGEYDRAESILRKALAGAEAADDVRSRIAVRINLADACRYRDKLMRARPLYVEALRLARAQCPDLVDFAL